MARRPTTRRTPSSPKRPSVTLWLIILLVLLAFIWARVEHISVWKPAHDWFTGGQSPSSPAPVAIVPAAPAASTQSPGSAAPTAVPSACVEVRAIDPAQRRQPHDATVEQILHLTPTQAASAETEGRIYRVSGRLIQFTKGDGMDDVLVISAAGSAATITAVIPTGRCSASSDDGALYDELREDLGLRFGQVSVRPTVLSTPVSVTVSGVLFRGVGGLEIRPVIDLRVN